MYLHWIGWEWICWGNGEEQTSFSHLMMLDKLFECSPHKSKVINNFCSFMFLTPSLHYHYITLSFCVQYVCMSTNPLFLFLFLVSKTVQELRLEWKRDKPVTTPENAGLSLFILAEIATSRCRENETLPTGFNNIL